MPDSFAQLAAAYAQLASAYAALAARQLTPYVQTPYIYNPNTATTTTVSGNMGAVSGGRVPKDCGCSSTASMRCSC